MHLSIYLSICIYLSIYLYASIYLKYILIYLFVRKLRGKVENDDVSPAKLAGGHVLASTLDQALLQGLEGVGESLIGEGLLEGSLLSIILEDQNVIIYTFDYTINT